MSDGEIQGESSDLLLVGSTPSLTQFNPRLIPFQMEVVNDIRENFDYSQGMYELLLSGSIGSAKSILLAHLLVTHCLKYSRARALMGRKVLGDLKGTLIKKVLEHIEPDLREGRDYEFNKSANQFTFANRSELVSTSWHDKNFEKVRSLDLSVAGIEEITENDKAYKGFYDEISYRVGRLPHVPESWIIAATNPGPPSHWVYQHFMLNKSNTRKVYYSKTTDNPFLPPSYIKKLRENLDPRQARRMLDGEWIEITDEILYYNYMHERNFRDFKYEINPAYPIDMSHDFNIGDGKPMSANLSQYIDGVFHFFATFKVHGARTADILEEIAASQVFDKYQKFRVFGDATGKARDTRSIKSDYDIIYEFLDNYVSYDSGGNIRPKLQYEKKVPQANPPIRDRHNLVNAQFENANGVVQCYLYAGAKDLTCPGAKDLDNGFRLSSLKKGGNYLEDDSFEDQHATTAAGYKIHYMLKRHRELPASYRI